MGSNGWTTLQSWITVGSTWKFKRGGGLLQSVKDLFAVYTVQVDGLYFISVNVLLSYDNLQSDGSTELILALNKKYASRDSNTK
jgi:hypothetical protein